MAATSKSKKHRILSLYKSQFISISSIAKQVGCSWEYADKVIRQYGKAKINQEKIDNYKEEVFNLLTSKITEFSTSSNPSDFAVVIKALDRLAKFFNMDSAPTHQVQVTIPTQIVYNVVTPSGSGEGSPTSGSV